MSGMISRKTLVRAGRLLGASPAAKKAMAEADNKAIWFSTCRHCGTTISGDLVTLMQHTCPAPDTEPEPADELEDEEDPDGDPGP